MLHLVPPLLWDSLLDVFPTVLTHLSGLKPRAPEPQLPTIVEKAAIAL